MDNGKEKTSIFPDVNSMVAGLLDDIPKQSVRSDAEGRLAKIHDAVGKGEATTKMAIDIILMFPYSEAAPAQGGEILKARPEASR